MNASDFGKNRLWQGSLSQVGSQETGKPKDSSLEESPKLEILQAGQKGSKPRPKPHRRTATEPSGPRAAALEEGARSRAVAVQ